MSARSDLLPPNQTPFEGGLVNATELSADPDVIRTIYDAANISIDLLPWLAWGWNVPWWDSAADETLKREITAHSRNTHRMAGTLGCYKRLARYAGLKILDAITPPDKTFLGPNLTKAQRNAWLANFDQLRIYPFRSRGAAAGSHLGYCYLGSTNDPAACWPAIGDAISRIGENAYLWHQKTDTETKLVTAYFVRGIETAQASVTREVRLPGVAGWATFLGEPPRFLVDQMARKRFYRVTERQSYDNPVQELRITAAAPSQEPVSLDYEWVAAKGHAYGVFAAERFPFAKKQSGYQHAAGFLVNHDARLRIYKRFHLFDPSVPVPSRGFATHLGATRLGMPPYHAQIRVQMTRRLSRKTVLCGRFVSGFPSDMGADDRIRYARESLLFARAERDKVLLQTRTRSPITPSPVLKAGDFVAGQYVSEAH